MKGSIPKTKTHRRRSLLPRARGDQIAVRALVIEFCLVIKVDGGDEDEDEDQDEDDSAGAYDRRRALVGRGRVVPVAYDRRRTPPVCRGDRRALTPLLLFSFLTSKEIDFWR